MVTKLLAGRAKDLEDVVGVLAERGARLDLAHVRALLADLEAALGQSDLTPTLDRLLREARVSGARPPRRPPRRR